MRSAPGICSGSDWLHLKVIIAVYNLRQGAAEMSSGRKKVLLIEDEEPLAELIRQALEEAGFMVDVVFDGDAGLAAAREGAYSLIILDIMLPGTDGFGICKALRSRRDATPILMLTARDSVQDRVRGLETGADDYLPKPFAFPEMLARVRALLRRDKIHKAPLIRIADLELDTNSRNVTRAGHEISLTRREYELLEALATNEGRVLSRDAIRDRIWLDDSSFSNVVDVRIRLLRKKIDSGREPKLIHTIYGVGYTLRVGSPEPHHEL